MRIGTFLAFFVALVSTGLGSDFRIVLKVIDDEGKPVLGASAGFSWDMGPLVPLESSRSRTAQTGEDGQAVFTDSSDLPQFAYGAEKAGYYPTRGLTGRFSGSSDGKLLPWDKTLEVVLKRIRNPVPLIARRESFAIPVKEQKAGYDLVVGDWVSPWGKGSRSDVEFFVKGDAVDAGHFYGTVAMTFPGSGNGLTAVPRAHDGSEMRMPYEATDSGYEPEKDIVDDSVEIVKPKTAEQFELIRDGNEDYFIRIRTEMDADGHVIRAMYGKIHGPITFGIAGGKRRGKTAVDCVYYLNPTGAKNLEFDPNQNLFKPTGRFSLRAIVTQP